MVTLQHVECCCWRGQEIIVSPSSCWIHKGSWTTWTWLCRAWWKWQQYAPGTQHQYQTQFKIHWIRVVFYIPIGFMCGIFTNMCHTCQPNVGKYAIHGSYESYGMYHQYSVVAKWPTMFWTTHNTSTLCNHLRQFLEFRISKSETPLPEGREILQGASEIAAGSRYVRYESRINQDPKQILHFAIQWTFIHLQGVVGSIIISRIWREKQGKWDYEYFEERHIACGPSRSHTLRHSQKKTKALKMR